MLISQAHKTVASGQEDKSKSPVVTKRTSKRQAFADMKKTRSSMSSFKSPSMRPIAKRQDSFNDEEMNVTVEEGVIVKPEDGTSLKRSSSGLIGATNQLNKKSAVKKVVAEAERLNSATETLASSRTVFSVVTKCVESSPLRPVKPYQSSAKKKKTNG